MIKRIPFLLFLFSPVILFSQVVYQDISCHNIYDFLDELANLRVITINSVEQPYSKQYIADKLNEATKNEKSLTKRQKKELLAYSCDYDFYASGKLQNKALNETSTCTRNWLGLGYDPPGFRFQRGLLKLALQPIFGIEYLANEKQSLSYIQGGGRLNGYLGKHVGFYACIVSRRQSDSLVMPQYFLEMEGVNWKSSGKGVFTNTEFTGGISFNWNWGDFGVYKDRLVWGNNYHGSNILSGRTPSFPFIRLHLNPAKWIEFSYIHGWLTSNVIDSTRSTFESNSSHTVYLHKYIAANMVTLIPWKSVDFSLGNSVIYESTNPQLAFLLPFVFYNSIDATLSGYNNNAGENNQLFFDLSIRKINHLHLYSTLFIDEISLSNFFKKDKQSNLLGFKSGFRLTGLALRNATLTAEYTRSNPLVYKHFVPSLTFTSDDYCLGYFLRDNSQDVFIELTYKPLKGFSVELSYELQQHGKEYPYTGANQGFPFLTGISWKETLYCFRAGYQLINNSSIFIEYLKSEQSGDIVYSPPIYLGSRNTIIAGLNFGF